MDTGTDTKRGRGQKSDLKENASRREQHFLRWMCMTNAPSLLPSRTQHPGALRNINWTLKSRRYLTYENPHFQYWNTCPVLGGLQCASLNWQGSTTADSLFPRQLHLVSVPSSLPTTAKASTPMEFIVTTTRSHSYDPFHTN